MSIYDYVKKMESLETWFINNSEVLANKSIESHEIKDEKN